MQVTRSRRTLTPQTPPKEIKLDFTWLKNWLTARKSKLSALIIAVLLIWFLNSVLHNYYPQQLQNWLIPGSYIVLLVLLWLVQLYLFSYVFMNSSLAAILSLGLCWLIWLKLHNFEVNGYSLVFTLSVTAVLTGISKLFSKHNP